MNICCCSGSELVGRTDGTIPTKTESNSKRYGRSRVYTQLYTYKIWFPKRTFRAEKQLYGNQIPRGMVEAECIHRENLIPKTPLLSRKEALRESNFQRHSRRRMYTHRKFDSQNGPFEPEKQLYGSQISRGMVEGECIHRENLIPKTALLSQKEALRESNFQRHYGRSRMYTHRKVWFPKRFFRARKLLYGNQISRGMVEGECIHRESLIPKTALLSQKAALRESNFKRYGRRRV